jgi:hypothetical protein
MQSPEYLNLAVRLLGFNDWYHFTRRDLNAALSPLDEELSDAEFAARDELQMGVLADAGLGPVARELLDRANPTGLLGQEGGGRDGGGPGAAWGLAD